tara:strand:+ start:789 stop:1007 length:219 start_codon:yes stop_codon:yes gene_type:complete
MLQLGRPAAYGGYEILYQGSKLDIKILVKPATEASKPKVTAWDRAFFWRKITQHVTDEHQIVKIARQGTHVV